MKKFIKLIFPLAAAAIIVYFCLFWQPKPEKLQSVDFAMGSIVAVTSYCDEAQSCQSVNDGILASVKELDLLISKNSDSGEVFRLNGLSGKENAVTAELFDYISETASVYSASGGRLAVTSGTLTECWGIDTDEFRVPSEDEIKAALPLCGDDGLILDKDRLTLKTEEGQILNLGSVGKGIACDKAFEYLNSDQVSWSGAVISVGGSVGAFGTKNRDYSWTIGIRDPFGDENEYFAKLNLVKQVGENGLFVSTSGSYEKTFEQDGKVYHHILDLTTGYPVETELVSVTVKAETGLLSDALSTLCFVMGEEASGDILEKYGADAVFVYNDKSVSVTDSLRKSLEIVNGDYKLR